jgi:TonB family protein
LQKTAGTDTIIDLENPALRDRIQRSSHRQMKSPAIPADLRHQHAHGRVIVGAVVERDATVSHAKVVGPSGYPSFDELARRSVDESSYDEPTKLDGKPVRAFFYAVIDFEAK